MSDYIPDHLDLEPVPTQTQFSKRAVARTIVAYCLSFVTVWVVKELPGLEDPIRQATPYLIEEGTNAAIIAVGGFYTWLMARPKINKLLGWIWLSAAPLSPRG